MFKKLFIFFAILSFVNAHSQTYHFKSFGVKEGLIQSNTTCGIQSKDGYLWLGTESGLSKFDGSEFVNYTKNDGLSESNITSIYEDRNGTIWIGHVEGGVSKIVNGKIHSFSDSVINKTISNISEDLEGNIWLATLGEGAVKFHPDSNKSQLSNYTSYLGKEGLGDYVFQVYRTSKGKLWFVTDVGLKSFNKDKSNFNFEKIDGMPSFQVTCMLEDAERNLWLGTYLGGLFKYSPATNKLSRFTVLNGLSSNWVSCISRAKDQSIWVGSWGNGVSRVYENKIETLAQTNGLNDPKIRFILQDREENQIIGTNEHGFSIFNSKRFEIYNEVNGLSNNQIWTVANKGKVWYVGHNEGVSLVSNGKVKNIEGFSFPVRSITIKGDLIYIATWGYGVFEMAQNRFFTPLANLNNSISLNVNNISLQGNLLWISTIKGLTSYNLNTKEITNYPGIAGKVELDIAVAKPLNGNQLLIGTRKNGLIHYNGNEFKRILESEISAAPTSVDIFDKKVIVGTEGAGVYLLEDLKLKQNN